MSILYSSGRFCGSSQACELFSKTITILSAETSKKLGPFMPCHVIARTRGSPCRYLRASWFASLPFLCSRWVFSFHWLAFLRHPLHPASAVQEPAPYGHPLKPPPVPPGGPPKESTDPQVKAVLAQMAAAGLLEPKTLEQARKSFLFYSKFAGSPEPVFHVEDRMIPGPAGDIPIRVYAPRAGGGLPVLVFFHGGGFAYGSLDTHDVPLRAITNRCDCVVVSVAYRLAPENPYPAAPDDAYAATKWVAEHAQEIGGDPRRIAVGGDGAGGNLAAVVAMMARDRGGPHLMYQVLIYPSLDPSMLTYSWIASHDPIATDQAQLAEWSVYIPVNTDPSQPYISPINGNLHNLPPAFMIVGDERSGAR